MQKSAAHLCTKTTSLLLCFPHIFPCTLKLLSCKDCVVSCQCFVIKGEFIKCCFVPVLSIETLVHYNWRHFINKVGNNQKCRKCLCHHSGFSHIESVVTECK